jgi:cytoskeletal protein CcmA (bactofilin family)
VAGHATIAAGDVSVRGPIKGSLSVIGGRALIDATVDGDVTVTARQIELGPHARIGGALRWRSQGELQRHASAQVAGSIEQLAPNPGREGSRGGCARPGASTRRAKRVRSSVGWQALGGPSA